MCDYCKLLYKSNDFYITENYKLSYHKDCFRLFINPKKQIKNPNNIIVNQNTKISNYLNDVKIQLNEIGIIITEQIEINLLEQKDLAKECKKSWAAGCAKGSNVFIKTGFGVSQFKGILAHELTHVWQYEQGMLGRITAINREGLAELVKNHIFMMDSTKTHNYIPQFHHRPKSKFIPKYRKPYISGYRKMKKYLDAHGWKKLIEGYSYYF